MNERDELREMEIENERGLEKEREKIQKKNMN